MSFDYYLVVPAGKVPTFDQLQAALVNDHIGVSPTRKEGIAGTTPYVVENEDVSLEFFCNGVESCVEGWVHKFEEDDFDISQDGWEPYYNHEVVEFFKKNEISIVVNDVLIHISFWDPESAFGGWCLICSCFVKNFGAVFYDPQSGEIISEDNLINIGREIYQSPASENPSNSAPK